MKIKKAQIPGHGNAEQV